MSLEKRMAGNYAEQEQVGNELNKREFINNRLD
jgi:hypothetical protein